MSDFRAVKERIPFPRALIAALFALALSLAVALPAGAARHKRAHKLITWGSTLQPAANRMIPGEYAADAEFWGTALPGPRVKNGVQQTVTAPKTGQLLLFRLKVGDDSNPVKIRFTVVHRTGGSHFRVITTSTPSLTLPAHSPGIHTFSVKSMKFPMPIHRGDYVAVATPGVVPPAMLWFGSAAGASAESFTAHGATQNSGAVWSGAHHPGVELLLQLVERPGPYRG